MTTTQMIDRPAKRVTRPPHKTRPMIRMQPRNNRRTKPKTTVRADSDNLEEEPPPAESVAPTVFDALADAQDLTVVTGLLRDVGLDATLATGGPYTIFAPTDDAVTRAAASDTTVALLESAPDAVLSFHVVPGQYTIEDLTDLARGSQRAQLTTLQGEVLTIALDGEQLLINGVTALSPDGLPTDNGIAYRLDDVLIPPVASLNTLVAQEPILFDPGSATIDPASFPTLDRFIDVLRNSSADVIIEGHTDSSGDPILNQNLSESRARSVRNYLVANGIEDARLTAVGFGPDQPVADNNTEEGRALNRRIEFNVEQS